MKQLEIIKLVVERLGKAGIDYFITGSIASTFYGIPRFTHDIDIVITVEEQNIDDMIILFSEDGYISKDSIMDALARVGMFNYIHEETGLKVDFWINRNDPFARSCFSRARKMEITEGFFAVMASPEDVLLHKVYWNKLTPSERQIGDARGIMAVQGENLDHAYIAVWAEKLDVEREIKTLLADKEVLNLT